MVEILPSILAADFARLAEQIHDVETGGASILHLDVMDGRFVPNISFGPPVIRSIRAVTRLHLDVHLMIEEPERYIKDFVQAGANSILVHQEACRHLDRALRMIEDEGLPSGVVINPATPVSTLHEVLDFVDIVLVMSVNPGFGGQKFIPRSLRKVMEIDRIRQRDGRRFKIEIDGGIHMGNVADAARAGCDWIVAGSSVFGAEDPGGVVRDLKNAAQGALAVMV